MLRFFRIITRTILACVLLGLLAVFVLGTMFLQKEPLLTKTRAPEAADVAATRALVHDLRATMSGAVIETREVRTNTGQLNSALHLGARFLPGFRGNLTVYQTHVRGVFTIPVPWWDGTRFLNVIGLAPEFTGRFALSELFVGDRALPPGPTLEIARISADLLFGDQLGSTVLRAATAMRIEERDLIFALDLEEMGSNGVMRGTFQALKGDVLPTAPEIEVYHVKIRDAIDAGILPQSGSFLPYLHFTLQLALDGPADEPLQERYTTAILGLTKTCGARAFSLLVGRLVFDQQNVTRNTWVRSCPKVTLNERIDSRRHFLTAAALQAISNTGFSVSLGEFKELHDTLSENSSGGFDFTDMAANLSGIRFSNVLMADDADWAQAMARMETERDIITAYDGIPSLMTGDEFAARFTDIDSAPYREMIARIETRIDELRLYRAE